MKKFLFLSLFIPFSFASADFSDVKTSSPFFEAIEYSQSFDIVNGYPDGTFQEEKKINRAEFTKIIINAAFEPEDIYGENCFPDVTNQWFAKYVCTAKREGIIKGYSDGNFRPTEYIAFVESAKIILLGFDIPLEESSDIWFEPFVKDLSLQRTIPDSITTLDKQITRGEMIEMIWRTLEDIHDTNFSEYKDGKLVFHIAEESEDFDDKYFYDEEFSSEIGENDDTNFESLKDDYEDFSKDFKEFSGNSDDISKNTQAVYSIGKGEKFSLISGTETSDHKKIIEWLFLISPDKFSDTYLVNITFLTKTEDQSAAFVSPNSDDDLKWDIFINMQSFSEDGEKEMVFTLIHEFAHIVTLNKEQIVFTEEKACTEYFIQEGCLNKNAYLNRFYQKYWKGKFNVQVEDSLENYSKKPSAFVTEYSATNPGEDIAESFAFFVFKNKPTSRKTIADQKILFFWEYPELVKIRSSIRSDLSQFIK